MSETTPPQIPHAPFPPLRPPAPRPYDPPLGELPADREPVQTPVAAVESILREPRRLLFQFRQPGAGGLAVTLMFLAVVGIAIYGLVVGSFSMGTQLWVAPAKLALGLVFATIVCLPSLYIFSCLSGSKARLGEICGHAAGLILLMTLLLLGFAPVAWLFSQSTQSAVWMGALHLAFWAVATVFGLRFLSSGFAHSHARSQAGLNVWMIIFVLVVLQMTTALRPLIGKSYTFLPSDKKLFLAYWGECMEEASRTEKRAANDPK